MKTKLLAAVGILCLSNPLASAFFLDDERWTLNRTVLMHLNLFGETIVPVTGPGRTTRPFSTFDAAAAAALQDWNPHMVHMQFTSVSNSGLAPAAASGGQAFGENLDGDANNSVIFSQNVYGDSFGSGTLAVALRTPRNGVYVEVDVIFNQNLSWGLYTGAGQSGTPDFYRVALHEFGHVLGLNHPDQANPPQNNAAIMNSTSAGLIFALQQDDIDGAHAHYDAGPARLGGNNLPNLLNISTRSRVELGNNVMIGGFIIQGSQPATVVIRAIGGSLPRANIMGQLVDPELKLFQGQTQLQYNDDWIDSPNAETIASYGIDPTNSIESAIYAVLQPGTYTAVVSGLNNTQGVALVEVYNLGTSSSRSANISTRARVQTGDNVVIAGFISGGSVNKEVLVRGIGPSLALAGPLADPTIELRNVNGTPIDSNDNWQSDPEAQRMANNSFNPTHMLESAFITNIAPGTYTVILRGVNNGTGIGLVEVFDLAPAP